MHRDQEVVTSFTRSSYVGKPLSVSRDDRRGAPAMDGALQKKKNKIKVDPGAMSRIS